MSAVVGDSAAAGSQKYVNFDEYVDFQVNKTRSGIRNADLLSAVVTVLLVVAGYLLAFVVADQWLIEGGFAYWPRVTLLACLAGFVGVWTTVRIVLPYWRRVAALYAARELEQSQPELKSSLLTLVDLKRAGRNVAPHILSAMEKRAALQLSQIDVEQAVDRRPLMRLAYALFGVVLAFCLYTVLSPKPVGASILRALLPVADIGVATRTRILKVDPGDATILARSQLDVIVDLGGEIPPEATLLYTTRDASLVDEPVVLRDTGEGLNRFRGTLSGPNGRGLLQDFTYRVAAGDAESDTYRVSVKQAPFATVDSVTYTYPSYMGLDPRTQSGGMIDAWEGTQVALRAVTNMPVSGATLRLHDSEDTSLKGIERRLRLVDETHIEGEWTLEFNRDGTAPRFYSIDLVTSDGQRDPVPRLYSLAIRRDLPPEIKLLHPSGDIELPANAVLPVSFAARDPDFMLQSVRMLFEKGDQPLLAKSRRLYEAPPPRSELLGEGEVDLAEFDLKPGDVLTFWLEAADNMAPLGPKSGNTTVTSKINISIAAPVAKEEVEQRRAEEAAAAREKLEEAQSQRAAGQEPGEQPDDGEPSAESESETAEGTAETEPGAGDQNPKGAEERSSQTDQNNQPAGESAEQDGSQPNQSGDNPGETSSQPNAEQQPGGKPADTQNQAQSGTQPGPNGQPRNDPQQSRQDSAQSSNSGNAGKPNSQDQNGTQTSQKRNAPQPGHEASDDEALAKFFEKYKDDIEKQREQQEQNGDRAGDQGESGDDGNSEERDAQRRQRGDRTPGETGQDSGDDPQQTTDDAADSTGKQPPTDGAAPEDKQPSGNRSGQGEDQQPPDETAPTDADAGQSGKKPELRERTDGDQNSRSNSDPRANQDPRADEQDPAQRGSKPTETAEAQPSDQRDSTSPMTGESATSKANDPSQEQKQGESSDANSAPGESSAGEPSEQQTKGEKSGSGTEPSKADETGINNPNPAGETGLGTNDHEPTDPSKTGGQPSGANESDPGEGNKDGQRSDQPSTGEQGSSQQTDDGKPGGDQSGDGEPSQSAGSKSETGKPGQSSNNSGKQPGQGEPAGQQPGESQPGAGGSQQKSSSNGGSKSKSGNPSNGDQQPADGSKSGDKPQGSGEQQGSGEKGDGEEAGEKRSGEQGGREKSGDEKGGGEQGGGEEGGEKGSGEQGGGEKGGGEKGGAEKGGGEKGAEQQGAGQQGGGEQGSGEKGGGEKGGGESQESGGGGGDSGSGESGEGSSSQPGNTPSGGPVKQMQPGGGRTGAGGRGADGAAAPAAGGGEGGPDAGPAEPADLSDKKRATELVLRKLEDELSRGDVSPELLQDLGWTEENLHEFMERLDRRLSDDVDDQSPEAQARRRQFTELLKGIDYSSAGRQKAADVRDRPVETGSGVIPRRPAPAEFRSAEEGLKQKQSRQTRRK